MMKGGDLMPNKYRKRPVIIKAVQWTGDNIEAIRELTVDSPTKRNLHLDLDENCLFIETLEGTMKANLNDYIIKGVQGEFYPCKPDIFEQTYEKVT